jgi:hypothetical protein
MTLVTPQTGPEGFAEILTVGVSTGFTVIVMPFDTAVELVTQAEEEVICTVTSSPLAREVVLNVVPVCQMLVPFTLHLYVGYPSS